MHLESIKYQIQNYFNGIKVFLIISDDGSTDKTLEICRKWIEQNKDFFSGHKILGDGVNRGLCANFLKAYENVHTKYFFYLAGDDIYGFNSLRSAIQYLEQYDIVSAPCLAFCKDSESHYQVKTDYKSYKTIISKGLCQPILRRAITISGCIVEAAPVAFRRELLSKEVLAFIGKFRMIEDQPMMYLIFKNNKIRLKYLDYTYVMYRINFESISHTKNAKIKRIVREDLEKLCKNYFLYESNFLYKYIALLRREIIKGHKGFSYLLPTYYYLLLRQNFFNKRIKDYHKRAISEVAEKSKEYILALDLNVKEIKNI